MQYYARLIVLGSVVMAITACAPAPSASVVRPGLRELGRIGITSPTVQPGTEVAGLPPRGTVDGALAGTAAGSFVGAFECLVLLYPLLPAYPLCMAVLAASGTVSGIAAAEPREIVDTAQEMFTNVLTTRNWQSLLRQNIVNQAAEEIPIDVSDLGVPQLLAKNIQPSATEQKTGKAQTAGAAQVVDIYHADFSAQADTLMEVSLVKLATWFSGDHKFGFVLIGQAQLIRSSDLVVLTSTSHYYVSPSLPLPEWIDHDGALIGDTVQAGVDYLARDMVRAHLHAR